MAYPYIPDPCLDYQKIQQQLELAGLNRVSMPLLNRNHDAPLPANLRIKIYIHSFDDPDSYIFHIGLAIARPVLNSSVSDSLFYAEVWHSDGVIRTARENELQEKINKTLADQLGWLVPAMKTSKSYSSKSPAAQDPNLSSPKFRK
jgi:hypothetical protein